jgi:2-methylisocitrate lyase-like PEP mutase family enzyme
MPAPGRRGATPDSQRHRSGVERQYSKVERKPSKVERQPPKVERAVEGERGPSKVERRPLKVERQSSRVERGPPKVETASKVETGFQSRGPPELERRPPENRARGARYHPPKGGVMRRESARLRFVSHDANDMTEMKHAADRSARFLALHAAKRPLLMANAWDVGSARLLASLGFQALATTSSGYAATLGRLDYSVTREEAVAHAAALLDATDLPVSADFEDGFGGDLATVAETVRLALEVGLAGCSVEDWSASEQRLYDSSEAAERVAAAAEVAHAGPVQLVLTARAENYLRGNPNLSDTIARLHAYQEAGADVLYAPGIIRSEEIRELIASVDLPVNVLVRPGLPPVGELAALGVKRVSVGGAFAFAALGAAANAANELLDEGTYRFTDLSSFGASSAQSAFD